MKGKVNKILKRIAALAMAVWIAYLPIGTVVPEVFAADTYSITINVDQFVATIFLTLLKEGDVMAAPTISNEAVKWTGLSAGEYILNTAEANSHPDMKLVKSGNIGEHGEIVLGNEDWTGSLQIVTTNEAKVPFELDSRATLISVQINDTDESGIHYDEAEKKVVIPAETPAETLVDLKFTFKLPLSMCATVYTNNAMGATTLEETVIESENENLFRKYTCTHTVEVGNLMDLVDMKIVPKLRFADADTGTIQFLDASNQPISDISTWADVTYTAPAWQKSGLTYYRSEAGTDKGAEVTITPKPQYEYEGCSLDDSRVTRNNDDSVTLQIRDEDMVTITLKPLTVFVPANDLEWTDELGAEVCNSKNQTVQVTLTPTEEEKNKGYILQYAKAGSSSADISSLTWTDVAMNGTDGKYHFDVSYVPGAGNDDEDIYIAYRYSKAGIASDAVWSTKPIRFDATEPSFNKIWVEADGVKVWEESQPPIWINKQQENSCVVKLQAEDSRSGFSKIIYGIKDATLTYFKQNEESYADADGICTIPYTSALQGKTTDFPIVLEYTMQDKAGNASALQTKELSDMVRFDFTAPEMAVAYQNASGQLIGDLNQWQTGEVRAVITVTDPAGTDKEGISGVERLTVVDTVSGVAEDISGEVTDNQDGTYTVRLSTDAAHQLSIAAYDKAGNRSNEIRTVIKIDKGGIQNTRVTLSTVSKDNDASQFADAFTVYAQAESVSGISEMVFFVYENGTNRLLKEQRVTSFRTIGNLSEAEFRYEPSSDEENGYVVVRFRDCVPLSGTEATPHMTYSEQKAYAFNKNGAAIQIKGNTAWTNADATLDIQVDSRSTMITSVIYYVNNQKVKEIAVNGLSYEDHTFTIRDNSPIGGTEVEVVAVCGANAASRIETRASIIVHVDKQVPVIQLSGVQDGAVYNKNQTLQITTKENIWNQMQPISVTAKRTLDGVTTSMDMGSYEAGAEEFIAKKLFSEDGFYEVTVTTADAAGNRAIQKISFTIDKTAPVISMLGVNEGTYSNQPVTLQFQSVESFYETNTVKITVARVLDGTSYTQTLNFRSTDKTSVLSNLFSEDGDYTITMTAVDRAGNAAAVQTLTFTVDCTAPTVTLNGTKDYLVTQEVVTLNFVVTEAYYQTNQVTIQGSCRGIDGKTEAFAIKDWNNIGRTSSMSREFQEDGYYTVTISATDKAGNSSQQTIHFTIDTKPPVIGDLSQYDGKYLSEFELGNRLESLITELTVPTVKMTINGEAYDGGKITADGKYTFMIEVTDEVGLQASKTIEFVIDTTAPKIIFAGAENRKTYTEPVNLNLSLENESDTIVSILINGEPYELEEGRIAYDLVFDTFGSYEVVVNTVDAAGNENSQTLKFTYAEHKNTALLVVVISCGGAAGILGAAMILFKKKWA